VLIILTFKKNHLGSLNEELVWNTSNNRSLPFPQSFFKKINRDCLKKNLLVFGLLNFIWLIFRSGTKPSRLAYPCQQAALNNLSKSLSIFIPLSITSPILTNRKNYFSKNKIIILGILILGVISSGLFLRILTPNPPQKLQLILESQNASVFPASDIYVVYAPTTPVSRLINLMSSNEMFFYKSNVIGEYQGPEGLISHDDVVLLKINSQWSERGGTNTDLLLELIQLILGHPDGFIGEIIVADNGQGRGSMNFVSSNAEDHSQSTQDVVNMFSATYNISTYDWQQIRSNQVDEYSNGDMLDGYILYDSTDSDTGIYVSYPKFKTEFGTHISLKHGLWNGTGYEKRLKVINLPVLKSHLIYGVTASIKNYMGVQSEVLGGGLANGHNTVATGGMGSLLVECGLPTLNIIDAIWVNANPYPWGSTGPATSYYEATRLDILIAGVDPIALDYWAAKHILLQTAKLIGYENPDTLDPDTTEKNGLKEAFGVWLNLTKEEILRGGFNVTTDENHMNIMYDSQNDTTSMSSLVSSTDTFNTSSSSLSTASDITTTKVTLRFDLVFILYGLTIIPFFLHKKGKRSS